MKVLFVSPSFHPASYYGGPTIVNRSLCEALAREVGVELKILTTDSNGPVRLSNEAIRQQTPANYSIRYCRRILRPDIAPGLLLRLPGMIRRSDVVHLVGVYCITTLPTLALCKVMRKPVLWSTCGALQRWSGTKKRTAKRLFERLCEALSDPARVTLHASSYAEEAENRAGLKNVSSAMISYGVDLVASHRPPNRGDGPLRLLYLGRLDRIKGIENLLQALTLVRTDVSLDICGRGDRDYEAVLRSLAREYELNDRVCFHGEVQGEAKEQQFRQTDLCVVPSFRESFGAVIGESLAHGVPVIASCETPWQMIEEIGCGLWVGNGADELAKAIDRAASLPLPDMGARGREWMTAEFSWEQVTDEMLEQYRLLMTNKPGRPGTEIEAATS
jgi:glycosyltransferase involved in cell wall biosynthesis